jgi:crotonobetainyl-CoA:carnitine CoA-transferase CaiB-like acyl-CoA transferase
MPLAGVVFDFGQVFQGLYATLLMAKALPPRDAQLEQASDHVELEARARPYWQSNDVPPRTGSGSHSRSPLHVYPTSDGYVAINVAVEEHWHHLVTATDREDLRDDPRFGTNADLVEHIDVLPRGREHWGR